MMPGVSLPHRGPDCLSYAGRGGEGRLANTLSPDSTDFSLIFLWVLCDCKSVSARCSARAHDAGSSFALGEAPDLESGVYCRLLPSLGAAMASFSLLSPFVMGLLLGLRRPGRFPERHTKVKQKKQREIQKKKTKTKLLIVGDR